MEVASEQSEKGIAAGHALSQADEALRRLTANMMRIAAGAGKPCDLIREASAFIGACVAYSDAAGPFPSADQLGAVLRPRYEPGRWEGLSEENVREALALEEINVGVLRSVAARLLGQRTQGSNADHLIFRGVNAILTLRRERDALWDAQRKAEVAATRKPRKATKKKPTSAPRNVGKLKDPA